MAVGKLFFVSFLYLLRLLYRRSTHSALRSPSTNAEPSIPSLAYAKHAPPPRITLQSAAAYVYGVPSVETTNRGRRRIPGEKTRRSCLRANAVRRVVFELRQKKVGFFFEVRGRHSATTVSLIARISKTLRCIEFAQRGNRLGFLRGTQSDG